MGLATGKWLLGLGGLVAAVIALAAGLALQAQAERSGQADLERDRRERANQRMRALPLAARIAIYGVCVLLGVALAVVKGRLGR